jgi:hypothetical protein
VNKYTLLNKDAREFAGDAEEVKGFSGNFLATGENSLVAEGWKGRGTLRGS